MQEQDGEEKSHPILENQGPLGGQYETDDQQDQKNRDQRRVSGRLSGRFGEKTIPRHANRQGKQDHHDDPLEQSPRINRQVMPRVPTRQEGVIQIAARVEARVMLTESATFPRAKKTTTLEAVPPGQEATRIKPTAISGGKPIE